MFTSFDERVFRQAIKAKDYLCLKSNTVCAMWADPTFERGETAEVLQILEKEVPEIFEEYVQQDYEERLERSKWDKRYFTKLTYWFQENFAKERVAYIKEVGNAVYSDAAKQYHGVVNELLKLLEDSKDYQNLYKYAAQSLSIAPGNVKAHYWLIVAMFNLGADEMADAQLEESRRVLTVEEYYDLTQSLKQARITEPSNLFRNEKLPM